MSEKHLIDSEIKAKMASYEVKPPDEVWTYINKQRSYGHITANRIQQSFYIMGLIAIIAGAGYYFMGASEELESKYNPSVKRSLMELPNSDGYLIEEVNFSTLNAGIYEPADADPANNSHASMHQLPEQDLTASIDAMALGLDPKLFEDHSLRRLLQNVEDISIIKPFELVQYEKLSKIKSEGSYKMGAIQKSTIKPDYWPQAALLEKKRSFALLLSFNPEFINKDFSQNEFLPAGHEEKMQKLIRSRKAYTFSARANYYLGKHGFFELGVDWTKIDELSQGGALVHNSSFSVLSVPLLFGQEFHFNRLGWEIKAGASYQLLSSSNGKVLSPDGLTWIELGTATGNPYKNSGVFNLHIATGISYLYSENLRFILEPYYKRSLNPVTKRNSVFNEKIEYMGIAVGIKKDL